MKHRLARAVLVSSIALLLLVAVLAATGSSNTPRADLVGEASTITQVSSVVPTTDRDLPLPSGDVTAESPTPEPRPKAAQPLRLEVPSVGIDSGIIPVGKNDDGSMELPGATQAGWYGPGPMVGALFGSAVIAAHVDYNGTRGVFFDLRKVELGDEIIATDINGVRLNYIVMERFQVDKNELQLPEVFRTGGSPVLTLITCGGAFDTGERRYDDNIVVRAVPAPE